MVCAAFVVCRLSFGSVPHSSRASHAQHAHRESATAVLAPPAAPLNAGLLWASAGDTARARKLQGAAESELNEERK